jgi:hypothetical protein
MLRRPRITSSNCMYRSCFGWFDFSRYRFKQLLKPYCLSVWTRFIPAVPISVPPVSVLEADVASTVWAHEFCSFLINSQRDVVRAVGIEPTLLSELDFESSASTNSTTPASANPIAADPYGAISKVSRIRGAISNRSRICTYFCRRAVTTDAKPGSAAQKVPTPLGSGP